MTPDEALAAAWTYCAPRRLKQPELPYGGFPTGFWPDVARVAIAMIMQDTIEPKLDFTPSSCGKGNSPEPTRSASRKSTGKISAAQRAENTARLLATLQAGAEK